MLKNRLTPTKAASLCVVAFGLFTRSLITHAGPPAAAELKAIQAVTVEAGGPKSGENGDRYFNIEGAQNKTHASFGVLRFDGANLKKELDSKYGTGKYRITNVTLQLTESRAKFSRDGPINIFFRADTTPNLNVQSLKYPYAPGDKTIGGSKIAVGTPAKTTSKAETEETVVEAYNLTNDTSGNSLKDALQAGKIVTLVLTAEGSVAETYAGLKGIRNRKAPTLVVSLNK